MIQFSLQLFLLAEGLLIKLARLLAVVLQCFLAFQYSFLVAALPPVPQRR